MNFIGRLFTKAVNANHRFRGEIDDNQSVTFDCMMAIVRCHATSLTNAINRLQFMTAWLESMELARALELAVISLVKVSDRDRVVADERLARLWSVVQRLQAMAPCPSDMAILQAGSRGIPASRNAWESERRAWITERRTHGRLLLSCDSAGLTLSSESQT